MSSASAKQLMSKHIQLYDLLVDKRPQGLPALSETLDLWEEGREMLNDWKPPESKLANATHPLHALFLCVLPPVSRAHISTEGRIPLHDTTAFNTT